MNTIVSLFTGVRFGTYKSFDKNGPFRMVLGNNITLIIGRNNCGKSSLIDVVESAINEGSTRKLPESMSDVCVSYRVDEEHLEYGFSKKTYRNNSIYSMFSEAAHFLNHDIVFQITDKGYTPAPVQDDSGIVLGSQLCADDYKDDWINCGRSYSNDIKSVAFRRVNAERDIVPETENNDEAVSENGAGATNLVRKYINTSGFDEDIVEKTILCELNSIMEPDAHFDSIRVQQVQNKDKDYAWEIYLEENGHRYALSKSGSGLKTILLILINLYLIPKTRAYSSKTICYGFEEIENNLHPALQRRVFEYLYNYAVKENIKILITSHSHIAINTFYDKAQAKLYHVTKEEGHSDIIKIDSGIQRGQIIDDLDVKASDLFQTNGIIWVEGPSDRIYVLRWLHIFTDFEFTEGQHFQFMYYGGRLLSHYEAEEREDKTEGLINILTTNRHAAIIMDSDKKVDRGHINETKRRIRDEFKDKGYFCWITKGKEIENYVASEAVNRTYDSNLPQIGQYELFPDYIEKFDKNFGSHKTDLARKMSQHITVENSSNILDLKERIEKLYEEIKKWN